MDATAIATLVEQLLSLGLTIYQQVESSAAAQGTPVKPLADILADADSKFAAIQAASQNA